MKDLISKEEAKQLFETKIKPLLGPIEQDRKNILGKLKSRRNQILIGALIASFIVSKKTSDETIIYALSTIAVISFLFYFVSYKKITDPYRRKFKHKVLIKIFEGMIGPCKFSMDDYIPQFEFDESKINNKTYNRYSGEDYLEGSFLGRLFKFSELSVQEVVKKGKKTETYTRFRGLFFIFKLPSHTHQNTLILEDNEEKYIGKLLGRTVHKLSERSGYDLVQLESLEFEKEFAVYSNDQIKCRVLLKPSVMERLVKFKKKYNESIDISIRGEYLYLAIKSFKNHFEPHIQKECINMNEVREIYDLFQLVQELLKDFEMNENIA